MTRIGGRDSRQPSGERSNILVGMAVLGAAGFLYLNFQPILAGTHHATKRSEGRVTTIIQVVPNTLGAIPLVSAPTIASTQIAPAQQSPAHPTLVQPAPAQSVQTRPATESASQADRVAMLMNLVLVEQGRRRLAEIPDYTCSFYKQERVGSELSDGQLMELKMRQKPYSIYLHWVTGDKGRELLYVEGEQDNKMIVHPGGWRGRLIPALKLDPEGSTAMRESRHPVTMVGLLKLSDEIISRRKTELERSHPVRCRLIENEVLNERKCWVFVSTYLDRKVSEDYRKSIQYVDKEWLLPVCVKNYGWPEANASYADENAIDEATLIEHYTYSDLQFNQQLANQDFEKDNTSYSFRR
jgi:Protein of unknown function (DUF1571)